MGIVGTPAMLHHDNFRLNLVIMFWKKVVILISYLLSAKRNLKMSSPASRSGSRRSRSRSRSRTPARRRSSRSRSQSGSEGECYGGSGQDNSFPPPGDVLHGYASNG